MFTSTPDDTSYPPRISRASLLLSSLWLGSFLLAFPATAQVVIKERVELQAADSLDAPEPLLSAEERARFFGTTDALKTSGINNTIIIPKDGTLRLAYGSAERLGVPYEAGDGLLVVMRNGQPAVKRMLATTSPTWTSATDTVFTPAWDNGNIFEVNCFGGPIDRYEHFTDELVDVLHTDMSETVEIEVEEDDEVSFLFVTTDFGGATYGDDFDEGSVLPNDDAPAHAPRWNGALGFYAIGCAYATDLLLFDVEYAEEVEFLKQNDDEIPTEEEDPDAVLMVSKFRTDDRLSGSVGFESGFSTIIEDSTLGSTNAGDAFTFRPQAANLSKCRNVEFRLRVYRDGLPVSFRSGDGQQTDTTGAEYYRYEARSGTLDDGNKACRARKHIRLVSNAPPPQALLPPNPRWTPEYDDEYRNEQTVRVELGDSVRVTVAIGGREKEATGAALHIGRPSSEDGPYARRAVAVSWNTLTALSSAPDTVTARMSEDFAQVGIFFEKARDTTYTEVQNVVRLRINNPGRNDNNQTWTPLQSDTLAMQVQLHDNTTIDAEYVYQTSDNLQSIAQQLRTALTVASGGRLNAVTNTPTYSDHGDTLAFYILVDRGNPVTFPSLTGSDEIRLQEYTVNHRHLYDAMMQAVAMNYRDAADSTMDAIVTRLNSLWEDSDSTRHFWGVAFPYDDGDFPGLISAANAMLLDLKSADEIDDLPSVAGHEAGHILLRAGYPAALGDHHVDTTGVVDTTHSALRSNIMWGKGTAPDDAERYGYHKRFTQAQAEEMRREHDPLPGSNQPRLLRRRDPD